MIRLGDGTDESHARMQRALDTLWPYTAEFFSSSAIDGADVWPCMVDARKPVVVRRFVRCSMSRRCKFRRRTSFLSRGKEGIHGEHLTPLLAEMQYLQRAYPNCDW